MSGLYLAKQADRAVWLAAEHDGALYGYVPNVNAFVYNKALTLDFLIDRDLRYEPLTAAEAATIIAAAVIGRIDARSNRDRLADIKAQKRRLSVNDVLGSSARLRGHAQPTATEIAHAKAEIVRTTPAGQWIVYKTYPPHTSRQTARQLASDLRRGRIRAFDGIPLKTRIHTSENQHRIIEITRKI